MDLAKAFFFEINFDLRVSSRHTTKHKTLITKTITHHIQKNAFAVNIFYLHSKETNYFSNTKIILSLFDIFMIFNNKTSKPIQYKPEYRTTRIDEDYFLTISIFTLLLQETKN